MTASFGRYELIRKIAEGGMAEVFLAVQRGPGGFKKRVAVKQILPHLATEEEFVKMFLDEARIAATLTHPNICQIFELGEGGGRYFIAMEYLAGPSLGQLMVRGRQSGKPAPSALGAFVLARAAEGLAYAHEKRGRKGEPLHIVHRDVSPQNIVVTNEGVVKLLDFGVARAADRLVETQAGRIRGNVLYMSPEQSRGQPLDGRSDVFSLGIILYELITGQALFKDELSRNVMERIAREPIPEPVPLPGTPEGLTPVALRALEKAPEQRLRSAREFSRAVDEALRASRSAPSAEALAAWVREQFPASSIEASVSGAPMLSTSAPDPQPSTLPEEAPRVSSLPREPRKRTRVMTAPLELPSPRHARGNWAWAAVAIAALLIVIVAAWRLGALHHPAVPSTRSSAAPVTPFPLTASAEPPPQTESLSTAALGRITLDTRPSAQIFFRGRSLGNTPLRAVPLPAGRQRLRAVNLGQGIDRLIEVMVVAGETTTLKVAW